MYDKIREKLLKAYKLCLREERKSFANQIKMNISL